MPELLPTAGARAEMAVGLNQGTTGFITNNEAVKRIRDTGLSLWTKQFDLANCAAEHPPAVPVSLACAPLPMPHVNRLSPTCRTVGLPNSRALFPLPSTIRNTP